MKTDRVKKYIAQRKRARQRGITWSISFMEWALIWAESGHWNERGKGGDDYVMSRPGDKGPYSYKNTKIITNSENVNERVFSDETKRKISESKTGKKRSMAVRKNLSHYATNRNRDTLGQFT